MILKIKVITKIIFFLSFLPLIKDIDIGLLRDINLNYRNEHFDGFFQIITNSVATFTIATPAIMCAVGWLTNNYVLKNKSIYIIISNVTVAFFSTALKYIVDRPRPFIIYSDIQKLTGGGSPSFPSGHTSDAFAFATSLSIVYPKWYIIIPSYIWAGAVGYSRMHLGVHYPSDVLAGAILGSASAWLCYKANQRIHKKKSSNI